MTPPLSGPTRALRAAAVAAVLVLGVTACGTHSPNSTGSRAPTQKTPPATAAPSAAGTTPAPAPAPSRPLSPFEDRAPVKALRAVFVAAAHAVNNADRSMATVRPLTTAGGQKALSAAFVSDFDHHALQPGPQPFTPIRVQVHGSTARVTACMLHTSWSLDRRTHRPWEPRSSGPIDFELTKVGGQWKFKSGFRGTASCAGVKIVKVRW